VGAWYAWREDVRAATDSKTTARDDRLIDRALEAATTSVSGLLHRDLAPTVATRTFEWPNAQYARPWRLWLDRAELISVTQLSSGGAVIPSTDYFLEPQRYGPPYDRIELDLDSAASFGGGGTHQRDITVEGLWGYTNVEQQVGALAAPLGASGQASVTLDPLVGVGAVLRVDAERMIVRAKTMVDTGQNLGGDGVTASSADTVLDVTNGTAFDADQVLLLGGERLLVVDVAGDQVVVKRAWDGSVLASHAAGIDIYALTGYVLDRGQLGTTAAAHLADAAIYVWLPPALARELCTAEAIAELQQHGAGWGRTVGSGESEREARGVGLADIRKRCRAAHGRQMRTRAV
jgi:hypothetical protein